MEQRSCLPALTHATGLAFRALEKSLSISLSSPSAPGFCRASKATAWNCERSASESVEVSEAH
eukprot:5176509-Amphidinium_carterae.1